LGMSAFFALFAYMIVKIERKQDARPENA